MKDFLLTYVLYTAVPDADKFEVETFEQLFCEKKRRPLLIGSVMSNIGNSHAASGISSVTKVTFILSELIFFVV